MEVRRTPPGPHDDNLNRGAGKRRGLAIEACVLRGESVGQVRRKVRLRVQKILVERKAELVNLPLVQRQSHNTRLTRSLAAISFLLVAAGLVVLAARERYR